MEAGSQAWVLEEQLPSRLLAAEPSSQPHHTSSSDLSYMVALFLVSVVTAYPWCALSVGEQVRISG